MTDEDRNTACGRCHFDQSPRGLTHEAVGGRHRLTRVGAGIPNKHTCRRGHVDVVANSDHVFNDIAGQTVADRDGVHPTVAGVIPTPDTAVGGDVENGAGVCKAVDDVGGQTRNQSTVPKLVGGWVKQLNAGWTPSRARQSDDELAVVDMHRVHLRVKGPANVGDGSGERVEFEHAARGGSDVQIGSVKVKVACDGVTGQGPSKFPIHRAVWQKGALKQAGSATTKVS